MNSTLSIYCLLLATAMMQGNYLFAQENIQSKNAGNVEPVENTEHGISPPKAIEINQNTINPQPEPPGKIKRNMINPQPEPPGKIEHNMINPQPEPPGIIERNMINPQAEPPGKIERNMINPQPEPPGKH